MGRLVIWIVTLVGLLPAVAIGVMGLLLLSIRLGVEQTLEPGGQVFHHNAYFESGSWRIEMNPQYWSVGLLLAGVAMILVALVAILRPQTGG